MEAVTDIALAVQELPRGQIREARRLGLTFIYVLTGPSQPSIRYVGKANNPIARANWEEREQIWIEYGRGIGWRLLNITGGGLTNSGNWKSTRARRDAGYYQSDAWRAIASLGGQATARLPREEHGAVVWATCVCGYRAHATRLRGHVRNRKQGRHEVVSTWCWLPPNRHAHHTRDLQ